VNYLTLAPATLIAINEVGFGLQPSPESGTQPFKLFRDIVEMRSGVAYEGIPIARDVARVQSTAQPLSGAVQFERNVKDAERIGQAMIERATAQDRQIGGNNKTALLMTAIANAPYVSAVCVAE
jgi:hypothetical protein